MPSPRIRRRRLSVFQVRGEPKRGMVTAGAAFASMPRWRLTPPNAAAFDHPGGARSEICRNTWSSAARMNALRDTSVIIARSDGCGDKSSNARQRIKRPGRNRRLHPHRRRLGNKWLMNSSHTKSKCCKINILLLAQIFGKARKIAVGGLTAASPHRVFHDFIHRLWGQVQRLLPVRTDWLFHSTATACSREIRLYVTRLNCVSAPAAIFWSYRAFAGTEAAFLRNHTDL